MSARSPVLRRVTKETPKPLVGRDQRSVFGRSTNIKPRAVHRPAAVDTLETEQHLSEDEARSLEETSPTDFSFSKAETVLDISEEPPKDLHFTPDEQRDEDKEETIQLNEVKPGFKSKESITASWEPSWKAPDISTSAIAEDTERALSSKFDSIVSKLAQQKSHSSLSKITGLVRKDRAKARLQLLMDSFSHSLAESKTVYSKSVAATAYLEHYMIESEPLLEAKLEAIQTDLAEAISLNTRLKQGGGQQTSKQYVTTCQNDW
mmetsp:Transcript_31406/g.54481  ORF Transcript_31406/g.54481 Transcript_31406/m.54481 type:complete len:263 (-) Transcript_31406:64-852(-)